MEDVEELPVDLEVEEVSVVVVLLEELVDEFDAANVRCKKLDVFWRVGTYKIRIRTVAEPWRLPRPRSCSLP